MLVVVAGLTIIILAWRLPEVYRTRRLKTLMPNALVLNSASIPSLQKSLAALRPADTSSGNLMPWGFSLVADTANLSLWSGLGREFLQVSWSSISRISIGDAAEVTRTSPAICIEVRSLANPVFLELVIFGRGPFRAFPLSAAQLVPFVRTMECFRDASAEGKPSH